MTKQELEMKLKNSLLEKINEVIKLIELDKLESKTIKCCNCGNDIDDEFVYCESCLDVELK